MRITFEDKQAKELKDIATRTGVRPTDFITKAIELLAKNGSLEELAKQISK